MAFSQWDWDRHPVVLRKIEYAPYGLTLPQWHKGAPDRNKLISIVTPTFPEQNTVHNVSLSTRAIITEKLAEAHRKIELIMKNQLDWEVLFQPENFFQSYNHFLVLSTHADNETKFMEFNGYIESRLRHLVVALEKNIFIKIVHPYPKSFDPLPDENLQFTKRFFFGLGVVKPDETSQVKIDLYDDLKLFEQEIMGKSHYLLTNPDKKISFAHCRRKDLKDFLPIDVIGRSNRMVKREVEDYDITPPKTIQNLMPLGATKRNADSKDSPPSKSSKINGSNKSPESDGKDPKDDIPVNSTFVVSTLF